MTREDILDLLTSPSEFLQQQAVQVCQEYYCMRVYLRHIIEVSNVCRKNCFYCGLRRDNLSVRRYQIPVKDVLSLVKESYQSGCRSIVIQSGERNDGDFVNYISYLIKEIKRRFPDENIVLSCGEQDRDTYKRWRELGADRYLLRIELSRPELYRQYHPDDDQHDFYNRRDCLFILRELGYQVGTGTLIGLPGTSLEDVANDILFFLDLDVDMLGFGPYVPHPDTPLYQRLGEYDPEQALEWTFRAIAVCRILMPTVNIASTTALDAIRAGARLEGFRWGANVLMPALTPYNFSRDYEIYSSKGDIRADYCLQVLGERVVLHDPGDPLHYLLRQKK